MSGIDPVGYKKNIMVKINTKILPLVSSDMLYFNINFSVIFNIIYSKFHMLVYLLFFCIV